MINAVVKKISTFANLDLKYILTGFSWLTATQLVSVLSSFIVTYLFANNLSAEQFGIYKYILGLGVLLAAFSLTGLATAIVQATSRGYTNFLRETTNISIAYGLYATGISLLAAGYYFYMGNNILATGCLLIAITHPVVQLFSNVISYQTGLNRFKETAILLGARSIIVSAGSIATLFFTNNILIIIGVFFILQTVVAVGTFLLFYPKLTAATPTPDSFKHIAFAKHTSVRNWFTTIASKLDSVVIFQNLGAVELAIYTIAALIPDQTRAVFDHLQSIVLPKYSQHKTLRTIRTYIFLRSGQLLLILIIVSIVLISIIPTVITIIFPTFTDAIIYAQLLTLALPTVATLIPVSALNALHREQELYAFQIVNSLIQVVLLVTLLFVLGLLGAILAKVFAQYIKMFTAYILILQAKD